MDNVSTARIIGDFLEINANILNDQLQSKYPKFISLLIAKYYRHKLIKSANRLRNSNMILNIDNLTELFIYVHNTYEGNYKYIKYIKIDSTSVHSIIDSVISIDNKTVIISIDTMNPKFSINCKNVNEDTTESFNLELESLFIKKQSLNKYKDFIDIVNKELLNTMVDYILDTIQPYNGKEKGYVKK